MNSRLAQFEEIAVGLSERGYCLVDQFLSPSEVQAIRSNEGFRKGISQLKQAGTGENHRKYINESIRGDYIQWIDEAQADQSIMIYLARLRELIGYVNQNLFLSLKDIEVHITMYPPGSFYQRHIDQFKGNDHRKLSVILYLNEEWRNDQGGQLRLHLSEDSVDIFPIAGRLVCFRSDTIEHEVLPATRERLSLTGWILDQLTTLKHL